MRVGVAGLGKMGAAIALRLIEVGHQVSVWNRSADKTKEAAAAGATLVYSGVVTALILLVIWLVLTLAPQAIASGMRLNESGLPPASTGPW